MDTNKLNRWFSIFANVSVLIGIVFLVAELQQANRIAQRDSRADIMFATMELNRDFTSNSQLAELRVKLRSPSSELNPMEIEQSRSIASNQVAYWTLINISAQSDLLPVDVENTYMLLASNWIDEFPGLVPYLREAFKSTGIRKGDYSSIYDIILDKLANSPY